MKTTSLLCALLTFAAAASAADSPWTGTWKLDLSRSHLTGSTFTVSRGSGGLLHYSDGSAAQYDFGLDGKTYKTPYGRAVSWTTEGPNAWTREVRSASGTVLASVHVMLSTDGATLTETLSGKMPDGSPMREQDVYTRVGGTAGLVGTWRNSTISNPEVQTFVISSPAAGALRFELKEINASVQGNPGMELPLQGPTVPAGATYRFDLLSPAHLKYSVKINGVLDSMGEEQIAADGRSFTDTSWIAGRENEKVTSVYVKQ